MLAPRPDSRTALGQRVLSRVSLWSVQCHQLRRKIRSKVASCTTDFSEMAAVITVVGLAAVSGAKTTTELPSFLFLLGDDIGWADFSYNGGNASSPNIDAWTKADGTITLMDFHSGGTVCSPTRASVLTGRTPFRDCVFGVYGCSDMTECVPNFPFAPQRTFTIADAVREASPDYFSMHYGKWHLGSFYNDSVDLGGFASSPVTHGFDDFNSTVEVAPTATTNCQCRTDWDSQCLFGHYHKPTHCGGGPNPGGPSLPEGCCFNYWWRNDSVEHAVSNLTSFVPQDDSKYLADSFTRFLERRDTDGHKPFLAQISFHNCHIPFIGTNSTREQCVQGEICPKDGGFSDTQLDFYACLNELDSSVGLVLTALEKFGYRENTMIWFTTDNGPEVNCPPEGICSPSHFSGGPGSAGPLRGRKRDTWEGGHRVPGIISWPAIIKGSRKVWDTVITHDFLPTIMDVLKVERPKSQQAWALDGISVMPLLRGNSLLNRCTGHLYNNGDNKGYRCGKWKLVNGSKSCANDDCKAGNYLLYDLSTDLGERTNVAAQNPEILQSMITNLTEWYASVQHSIQNESMCPGNSPSGGGMGPLGPPGNSSACTWVTGRLNGGGGPSNFIQANATSKEECCGLCANTHGCVASVYYGSKLAPSPTLQACNLRDNYRMAEGKYLVCVQPKANRLDKTTYSSG
eukprot:m.92044 g.92044  ORF g.92044 m.92044 type:complete len:685 (+) comp12005_c0_seq2:46-2100(+)